MYEERYINHLFLHNTVSGIKLNPRSVHCFPNLRLDNHFRLVFISLFGIGDYMQSGKEEKITIGLH